MMFLTERKFAPDLVVTWKPSGTPDLPKQAHNSLVSEEKKHTVLHLVSETALLHVTSVTNMLKTT